MRHHCHAIRCPNPCEPRMLFCRAHWAIVAPATQREVYRTVKLRGPYCNATWAPWWRAAHEAIAQAAEHDGAPAEWVAKYRAKQEAFADTLEGKEPKARQLTPI